MVKIVLTPEWFIGKDMIVDIFSFVVLLAFGILAYRYYKLSKNRNVLYLAAGFGLIAVAQLAAILTKLVLYYDVGPTQLIGQAIITSQIVNSVDYFYYAGFFCQRLFTLLGLYIIYRLPRERKSIGDYALGIYFIFISAFLGKEFVYLYHLTALFIIALIVENYVRVYRENHFFNTKILILAFSLLGVSQLIYALSKIGAMFVLANTIELISYAIFLALIIRIWKHGKEKKSNGHNFGYVSNSPRKRRNN